MNIELLTELETLTDDIVKMIEKQKVAAFNLTGYLDADKRKMLENALKDAFEAELKIKGLNSYLEDID